MNRMRITALAGSAAAVFALAAPLAAHATAYIYVYDVKTSSYLCQSSSATDAGLDCSGSIGSFTFSLIGGVDSSSGGAADIDLSFLAQGKAPPDDQLNILYYVNDLPSNGKPMQFLTTLGGTSTSKSIWGDFLSAYYPPVTQGNISNFCGQSGTFSYGDGTDLASFCGQTGSVFSDSQSLTGDPTGSPYELGLLADLFLDGSGIISGDFNVRSVPEPATLALFGAALLGGTLWLRRRRV
jgi:hypothetical protein